MPGVPSPVTPHMACCVTPTRYCHRTIGMESNPYPCNIQWKEQLCLISLFPGIHRPDTLERKKRSMYRRVGEGWNPNNKPA